jgi:hypothetical protein
MVLMIYSSQQEPAAVSPQTPAAEVAEPVAAETPANPEAPEEPKVFSKKEKTPKVCTFPFLVTFLAACVEPVSLPGLGQAGSSVQWATFRC